MDRRGFIQSVLGAAAMTVIPSSGDGVALTNIKHPHDLSGGFSLAPFKPEGASIPYDRGFTAEFSKLLKPGLEKMFGDVYKDLDPNNLEDLWVEIDDD